jgi:hypothetical protein
MVPLRMFKSLKSRAVKGNRIQKTQEARQVKRNVGRRGAICMTLMQCCYKWMVTELEADMQREQGNT